MERSRARLVEDKPAVLRLIAKILETSYDTTASTGGDAALALIGHDRFHVVLKDVLLAGVTGFDASRAGGRAPEGAVVMITAFANLPDAVVAITEAARRIGMTQAGLLHVLRKCGVQSRAKAAARRPLTADAASSPPPPSLARR